MQFTKQTSSSATPTGTTSNLQSKPVQAANVPYFPPPPGTNTPDTNIIESKEKPGRKFKPPPLSQLAAKLPHQPRKQSSLRHSIGYPTQTRRKRIQSAHLPDIKLSPRHWILVALLLLSFIVLVLGFIFADCVALPHLDKGDASTSDNIPLNNITLYMRRDNIDPAPTTTQGVSPASTLNPSSTTTANTVTPSEYLASESKRLGFDSPKNLAILFFYTATLPLLTILHSIIEIVVLCFASNKSSSSYTSGKTEDEASDSEDDNDKMMKPLSLAKKHNLSRRLSASKSGKLGALIPYLPAASLTASLILITGWITINAIQAHCELVIPVSTLHTGNTTSTAPTGLQICPIQTRGHFMHGIHEVSIVKNVFGWVLVLVYIGYAAWCVRINGLVWEAARDQRRARKEREAMEGQRREQLRRSVVRFSVKVDDNGEEEREQPGKEKAVGVVIREV